MGGRGFCTLFGDYWDRVLPPTPAEKKLRLNRIEKIKAVAKKMGFSVDVTDPGFRATFRKTKRAPTQNSSGAE